MLVDIFGAHHDTIRVGDTVYVPKTTRDESRPAEVVEAKRSVFAVEWPDGERGIFAYDAPTVSTEPPGMFARLKNAFVKWARSIPLS